MQEENHSPKRFNLTIQIIMGMLLGMIVGLAIKFSPLASETVAIIADDVLQVGGQIFINLLKMLVVPVVFVSLICGVSSIDIKKLGKVGGKTLLLYVFTTALAISIAIFIASLFGVGNGIDLSTASQFKIPDPVSLKSVILNIFPTNPFKALTDSSMLQIIIFALFFGATLSVSGKPGQRLLSVFQDANEVIMKLILIIMKLAPYGVFCLIAALFAKEGFRLIGQLIGYFSTVMVVLAIQLFVVYPILLRFLAGLNPVIFFKKMYAAMLFAFSVASSNASIPVVLETVEKKLGVKNSIASFVIPLGATINMDGTSIMQGVATVFIAHAYHIDIGLIGYLTVIGMATLASIGTAGVPSVGLITLTMVLHQVGLPVEGIALIIGVDRLLDMTRTAVNISGDSTVACVVGKSEGHMDMDIFNDPKAGPRGL